MLFRSENVLLDERRNVPVQQAMDMGAMALFGEKYGEFVRVITFDPKFSIELCGGTHVKATGQIGQIKVVSESAVAAGVRRIEAITADKADSYFEEQETQLNSIKELLKHPKDLLQRIQGLLDENTALQEQINVFVNEKTQIVKKELIGKIKSVN